MAKMSRRDLKKTKALLIIAIAIYTSAWTIFLIISLTSRGPNEPEIEAEHILNGKQTHKSSAPSSILVQDDNFETQNDKSEELAESEIPLVTTKSPSNAHSVEKPGATIPIVPPKEAPKGVSLEGEIFVNSCWDATGFPSKDNSCGEMGGLEEIITTRLYVVDFCRKQESGEYATGRLDMGMEVDFEGGSHSFWSRPSSQVPNGAKIANCLNSELKGLPLGDLRPKFARYHFSIGVNFGKPGETVTTADPARTTQNVKISQEQIEEGRIVAVIKDRVRVRKTPIDGEILGKISSGNRVLLVEESDGWCHVKTRRGNEGWMVCWALNL